LGEILAFAGAFSRKESEPNDRSKGRARKVVKQNKWGHWDLPPVPVLIVGLKELETLYDKLPHDASRLSKSLIEQFADRGQLTAKQWSCAVALLEQALVRSQLCPCPHCGGKGMIPNASAVQA
jgi:hypothetical protein